MPADAPLHIGLLTPGFAGVTAADSGIGVHFRHLADGLAAAGQRVTVLVVSDRPAVAHDFGYEVRGVTVTKPAMARVLGRFSWQLHQWSCLRRGLALARAAASGVTADIWETTSTGALALELLRRPHPAPFAVRVSTTAAQLRTTNAGAVHWVNRRIEAWEDATVRLADRVLTHTTQHRDTIARQFGLPIERIPIVPHGIPIPPAPVRAPRADRCRVLYVGRFEHRKGIDLLLAALPEVLAAAPHVEVTLVGADANGFWQNRWRSEAPAALQARVNFAGVVDNATLAAHYANADLFVAPSRYESFGLIFVEAMARALPVVALQAPGASDLIASGTTGVLVPPDDPRALAAALLGLAGDPARRLALGTAARREVEQRYSLHALTENSLAFYRATLAGRP